ncbi:MAG: Uma2 family endonuclease [Deltaproteobacteria bacterium]|nr:Uma2 family endonuclease [Deltaproteobacteria bacterium]
MAPVKKPATYEDVLAAPEHTVAEIVSGDLIVSPRPRPRHAHAAGMLFGDLSGSYGFKGGGPGGWWIFFEPELHLGNDVLVPDLAGYRTERMSALPDEAWFSLVPDWICEVLSPGTGRLDRTRKLPIYARHGVNWAWLVDPNERTLEVLRSDDQLWTVIAVHGDDDLVRAEPFPALEIDLLALWGERRKPAEPG